MTKAADVDADHALPPVVSEVPPLLNVKFTEVAPAGTV
jgi:hypothetical protein